METDTAIQLRAGGLDANGMAPEKAISDGDGNPCRHCLRDIEKGRGMLILSYRPFDSVHAYSETGPVFLCAEPCARNVDSQGLPQVLRTRPEHLIRAYTGSGIIISGTGRTVAIDDLTDRVSDLLRDRNAAWVHVRSAANSCYTCRVERSD